ncbi:copper-binding protein [Pseudomonas aeruginosa]|uniref:copper-binding protein n=1 Tax=Pseudomonas aeruginosa group TaxID=136841 RepID=UPI0006B2876A|nr:copper-binding protein [Pseudomonas aeruginosa]KRU83496.1 heat-shock protein HtpX [Pseudomonas aeruginosa]VTS64117.1 Cation efflux system protein CusF precursor [Streptococcus dysgalactiae subsp. equisimilis]
MNASFIALGALLFALSFPAFSESMPETRMDGAKSYQTARAEGTIKAIDPERHTVTLAHGPVLALQWPPMTMGFKTSDEQLEGLRVGDRVEFEFRSEGGSSRILSIRKK